LLLAVGCAKDAGVEAVSTGSPTMTTPGGQDDACSRDKDCAKGLSCNMGRHACVQCIVTDDCRAKERCQAGACEPLPRCASTTDCAEGVCDTASEVCVECVDNGDCLQGKCKGNRCVVQCEQDKDCTNQRCDVAAAVCVQCLDDADCAPNQFCDAMKCQKDVCRDGDAQCRGSDLLVCNASGSGRDATPCAYGCAVSDGIAACSTAMTAGTGPEGTVAPDASSSEGPVVEPGPAPEPVVPEPVVPEPAVPEPGASAEPVPEPVPEPSGNPEPVQPSTPAGPSPAVMIVAERSSSMFAPQDLAQGTGCATGSSPAYGAYPDRWEALRDIVIGLGDLADTIDFTAITYTAQNGGECPILTSADALSGYDAIVQALLPSDVACPAVKGEAPTGAAIDAATELLLATAPSAPKYLLLITRGVPDTCAVPDPQCGGDKAIAAVQNAYAQGIITLVVSLHTSTEFPVSEYLAHAGQGDTVPPYPEDSGESYCIEQEYNAENGTGIADPNWRAYAEASYGASGSRFASTLSYTGDQLDALHATLGQVANGTF
jgi:hypothetical protein